MRQQWLFIISLNTLCTLKIFNSTSSTSTEQPFYLIRCDIHLIAKCLTSFVNTWLALVTKALFNQFNIDCNQEKSFKAWKTEINLGYLFQTKKGRPFITRVARATAAVVPRFHNRSSHHHKMGWLQYIWHSHSCWISFRTTVGMLNVLLSPHFVTMGSPIIKLGITAAVGPWLAQPRECS